MMSSSESSNLWKSLTGVGGAYLDDRTPPISSPPGFNSTLILTDFFLRGSSAVWSSSSALEVWPVGFKADLTREPDGSGTSENSASCGIVCFIADLTGEAARVVPFSFSTRWAIGGVGGRTSAYRELCTPDAGL